MTYELTLAGPAGDTAAQQSRGSNGAFYALGAEADKALRRHPLAVSELGKPKHMDSVHLSIIDGTDFIRWMGRKSDGYHHQIGRVMKLIRTPVHLGRDQA